VTGYRGKMTGEQIEEFIKELKEKGFSNQREMIEWIYQKFGVKYSQQGMSDLLKRLGAKKKVGRAVNIKKNKEEEKKFKEDKFEKIVRDNPDKEIFFDESRFGLITQIGKQWRGRGIKPIIPMSMKFEYRYLYKAVSPKTGDNFSFIMPEPSRKSISGYDIKKYLKNKVFNTIEELEDSLCKIVNLFSPDRLRNLTFYPYIREAVLG
jgi:hypothetical protein